MAAIIGLVILVVCAIVLCTIAFVNMAKNKGNKPIVWGFIGVLFGLISLLICYLVTKKPNKSA